MDTLVLRLLLKLEECAALCMIFGEEKLPRCARRDLDRVFAFNEAEFAELLPFAPAELDAAAKILAELHTGGFTGSKAAAAAERAIAIVSRELLQEAFHTLTGKGTPLTLSDGELVRMLKEVERERDLRLPRCSSSPPDSGDN